jgi:hypothetical protein
MQPIDLRSDTVTRPTPEMRAAIASAEVGDDVYGEDPTVNRLQEVAAARFGKEAALFVPSGSMANQVAIRAHTEHGDAVIAAQSSHHFLFESGAAGALSGVQFALVGEDGLFGPDDLHAAVYPREHHFARTRLVCIENTHNRSGGRVFPFDLLKDVAQAAREHDLRLHLAFIWTEPAFSMPRSPPGFPSRIGRGLSTRSRSASPKVLALQSDLSSWVPRSSLPRRTGSERCLEGGCVRREFWPLPGSMPSSIM